METINLGERLFIWRARNNLKSTEASKQFDQGVNWFWNLEEGYNNPPDDVLQIANDEAYEPRDEAEYVQLLIRRSGLKKSDVCEELGIKYQTLYAGIKKCEHLDVLNLVIEHLEKKEPHIRCKNPWWDKIDG